MTIISFNRSRCPFCLIFDRSQSVKSEIITQFRRLSSGASGSHLLLPQTMRYSPPISRRLASRPYQIPGEVLPQSLQYSRPFSRRLASRPSSRARPKYICHGCVCVVGLVGVLIHQFVLTSDHSGRAHNQAVGLKLFSTADRHAILHTLPLRYRIVLSFSSTCGGHDKQHPTTHTNPNSATTQRKRPE